LIELGYQLLDHRRYLQVGTRCDVRHLRV